MPGEDGSLSDRVSTQPGCRERLLPVSGGTLSDQRPQKLGPLGTRGPVLEGISEEGQVQPRHLNSLLYQISCPGSSFCEWRRYFPKAL